MENLKNNLYHKLELSPQPNDTYKLLKHFIYKGVYVPKGYCTNGANIPRILWNIWPPNRSKYMPAVVIHDFLCDKEEYKKADKYFKEILELLDVNSFTIWCFHTGVTLYHRIKYI